MVQARRLPKELLQAVVRGRFEVLLALGNTLGRLQDLVSRLMLLSIPQSKPGLSTATQALEYPVSLERLYQLSPDEAIAEFYTDPDVFQSVHCDMPDLQLPAWTASAADFLRRHR
jgi:hypothetical protein